MTTPRRLLQTRCKELRLNTCNDDADALRTMIDEVQLSAPSPNLYIGVPDIDRQIYLNLNGGLLLNACSVNHYTRSVCDDMFWAMKARVEFGDGVSNDNKALYAKLYPLDSVKRLWWACERGYIRMVMFMVSNGVDIHANKDYALRRAAEYGHLEIIKYLVAHGADIHAENEYAIRRAAENGYLDVIDYLMAQGADIHAENDEALRVADAYGDLELAAYLVARGADYYAGDAETMRDAAENARDVVRRLVEHDADIHANREGAHNSTALNGDLGFVEYLVAQVRKFM